MIIRVPLSWLREYCDIPWPLDELCHRLTMAGLEVDSVETIGARYENVVVGSVLSVEKHPDADRLSVCLVDVGDGRLSVVCGAPNVAAGQRVPVALVGATLPGGLRIRKSRIRGVESEGMICSEAELALSDEADVIMTLDPQTPVGQPLNDTLGEPETVLLVDVGTNRPDCLALAGVAREIAALTGAGLRLPPQRVEEAGPEIGRLASVTVDDPEGCPRFVGRVIRNIRIGPSPSWLTRRLTAAGLRSINNVVDITNYVMLELGQPLHAYDLNKLAGRAIVVRPARPEERFTTLDGEERVLTGDILMIADKERGIGVAGIMGGLDTEITDATSEVFLEGACFSSMRVRRGSRSLQLSTDASRRFERGVDPELQGYAVTRAAGMIAELAGGVMATGMIDARAPQPERTPLRLRVERVNALLGTALTRQEIAAYLEALELSVSGDGDLMVEIPSFRGDLLREVDLIEEVARLYGYDRIPPTLSRPSPPDFDEEPDSPRMRRDAGRRWHEEVHHRLRSALVGFGFTEVTTHSFVHPDKNRLIAPDKETLLIRNPLSVDLSAMRVSLAASMLDVIRWNSNRKVRDMRIFEIGRVFWGRPDQPLPEEPVFLCLALTGRRMRPHWSGEAPEIDFFDLKGFMEGALEPFSLDNISSRSYDDAGSLFQPDQSALLMIDGKNAGAYGAVSRVALDSYDIREPVWMGLVNCEILHRLDPIFRAYRALPRFPSVERDLALVAPEDLDHRLVVEEIQTCCGTLLEQITLFDIYRGKQVLEGRKSLAYALRFRSGERTLTDQEVGVLITRTLEHLHVKYGVERRA